MNFITYKFHLIYGTHFYFEKIKNGKEFTPAVT